MPWSTDYRVSNIEFDSVVIGGVQSNSIGANAEIRRDVANGSLHAKVASLQNLSPVASFTTFDIAAAINAFGLNGVCVDVGTGPMHSYFQLQGCEGPTAGSVHNRYTMTEGVVFPRTLSVNHRGDASITYEARARFDGTNDPITKAINQALPAAPNADARWTMGAFKMPNIAVTAEIDVEGKRGISINFNARASSAGADSETFDRVQSLDEVLPTTSITGVESTWLDTVVAPLLGRSILNANPVDIYLRKRNTLDATAEHIQLRQQGLLYWDSIIDGSIGQAATSSFNIDSLEEGVNKPIAVNTAIAHP